MAINGTFTRTYTYDGNGNRLSVVSSAGTLSGTYDAQDRLLAYGSLTFTYGANGELESKADSANDQTTLYTYDARGSLRSVGLPSGDTIDYLIDGQARRVGKKVNGAFAQGFLYKDQLRVAAELDSIGNIAAQFTYLGSNHSPDYMSKGGVLYRFVKDQVSSVRLVVNAATGAIAQSIDYDEFGCVLTGTNPGFQPFGFAGGIYDTATGLVRFGARDYDAVVGRWVSKDPIRWGGGQENLYVYVGNDPVNAIDPTGTFYPVDALLCVYYTWKFSEAVASCHERVQEQWDRDDIESLCKYPGGDPGSQVLNCLRNEYPDEWHGQLEACAKTASGAAAQKSAGSPRAGAVIQRMIQQP